MNKQQFVDSLRAFLTEDTQLRTELMDAADDLIPSDIMMAQLEALNDRRVRSGYEVYRRFHPDTPLSKVNMGDVISWLMSTGGSAYINRLEERLARIWELVTALGEIDLEACTSVHNMVILELRCLSYLDPGDKPLRLRKLRKPRARTV